MDENTMTQINETEKKAVKHRGKTIAILVLSVLLAASVTLNITGLVRGRGMRTAMNDRIEQFDGGQMQGQMPGGSCAPGQMPNGNGPQGQKPGNGPQGQAPDGQQNSQKSDNKKSDEGQKQDSQQNKGSADDSKSAM